MRKSIMAVILITMLAIAGTTGSALAYTDTTTITVSPGSRVCLNRYGSRVQLLRQRSDPAVQFPLLL